MWVTVTSRSAVALSAISTLITYSVLRFQIVQNLSFRSCSASHPCTSATWLHVYVQREYDASNTRNAPGTVFIEGIVGCAPENMADVKLTTTATCRECVGDNRNALKTTTVRKTCCNKRCRVPRLAAGEGEIYGEVISKKNKVFCLLTPSIQRPMVDVQQCELQTWSTAVISDGKTRTAMRMHE